MLADFEQTAYKYSNDSWYTLCTLCAASLIVKIKGTIKINCYQNNFLNTW